MSPQAKLNSATSQRMQLEKMRADLSNRLEEVDQSQVALNRSLLEVSDRCRHEEEEIKGLERELLERETTFKAKQEQLGEMRRHISSLKEQQGEMERQVHWTMDTNKLYLEYSRLSLIGTPGDRRNMFVLSGVTWMHLYRLG